jgi:hypothetical protein
MLLMPLPGGSSSSSVLPGPNPEKTAANRAKRLIKKQLKQSRKEQQPTQPSIPYAGKGSPKGRGKGAGRGGGLPAEIKDLASKAPDGRPICYSANLDGCTNAEWGARCPRGFHLCMKCFGNHSQRGCKGAAPMHQ